MNRTEFGFIECSRFQRCSYNVSFHQSSDLNEQWAEKANEIQWKLFAHISTRCACKLRDYVCYFACFSIEVVT